MCDYASYRAPEGWEEVEPEEEDPLKKRIYNPVTHKYYEIRQNSSKYGEPGQIKGLWSSKKKHTGTEFLEDVVR